MMVIMSASVCTQIQKSSLMKVQTGLIGSIIVFVHHTNLLSFNNLVFHNGAALQRTAAYYHFSKSLRQLY